jgi:hypothetical protein
MKPTFEEKMGQGHVISEHTEPTLNGEIVTCWSTGCLSELPPRYARINKWSHGFVMVEVDSDGTFSVQNKRIYNEGENNETDF